MIILTTIMPIKNRSGKIIKGSDYFKLSDYEVTEEVHKLKIEYEFSNKIIIVVFNEKDTFTHAYQEVQKGAKVEINSNNFYQLIKSR